MIKQTKTVKLKQYKKDNEKQTKWNKEKVLEEEPMKGNVNDFIASVYERKDIIRECWRQSSGSI